MVAKQIGGVILCLVSTISGLAMIGALLALSGSYTGGLRGSLADLFLVGVALMMCIIPWIMLQERFGWSVTFAGRIVRAQTFFIAFCAFGVLSLGIAALGAIILGFIPGETSSVWAALFFVGLGCMSFWSAWHNHQHR